MILSTTDSVAGQPVQQTLGLVHGNTIRSKNIGKDIGASLKSIVGGELRSYTVMMSEARDEATLRMTEGAMALGANAVVGVRYTTSMVVGGAAEIVAYGTAARI